MLIILGGLPGTGKSSIARALAQSKRMTYLRIDSIEGAIVQSSLLKIEKAQDAGYIAAYQIAKDHLALGGSVVADSVNPIEITRAAWRKVAIEQNCQFFEVEIVCSSEPLHQERLAKRNADVSDNTPVVAWQDVLNRDYEPWVRVHCRLDTATLSVARCVDHIVSLMDKGARK